MPGRMSTNKIRNLKLKNAALAMAIAMASQNTLADGRLEGTLTSAQKQVALQGAVVRIKELNLETVTRRDGSFVFPSLTAGTYTLTVEYIGAPTITRSFTVDDDATETLNIKLGADSPALEQVLVLGQAASMNKALNKQRAASNITSVVDADAMGQFPDSNLAESLQRVPGVSLERDQGEGRFIRVRGLGKNFNAVNINGTKIPAPESDTRAVALDVVPNDLVESITVTKSLTPDMDADSLGGSINVESLSAFDRDGLYYKLNAESSYDEHTGETSPKLAATISDIFSVGNGSNNLGIVGSISWFDREFGSDNVETGGAWDLDDEPVLEEMEQRDYTLNRERLGAAFNIDYRLNANNEVYLKTLYSEYSDQEIRLLNKYEVDEDEDTEEEFIAAARELKDREETQKIMSMVFGGISYQQDWTYEYSLGVSKAEEDEPIHVDAAVFESEFDLFGFSGSQKPRPDTTQAILDPSLYEFAEAEVSGSKTTDKEQNVKLDISKDLEIAGNPAIIRFGGKISRRDKDSDTTSYIVEADDLILADVASGNVDYDLGNFGPGINVGALNRILAQQERELDIEASFSEDYAIKEDINAAYLMGTVDISALRLIAGVRYEGTKYSADGFSYDDDSETASAQSFDNDYDHWLPALHARYKLTDKTTVRAAWTHSVVRPTFEQTRPGAVVEGDEIEQGNPDLDPLESTNLDLGIEYYPGSASVISAFLFYKQIDNFIYETEFTADDIDFTTFENGDGADLYGVELAFSKQFTELPAPWNGLLFSANATYTDSDAEIEIDGSKRDIRLPGQSDLTSNIMLGYETERFGIRLAANHKSDYLETIGVTDNDNEDVFEDDHTQIDLTANYYLTDSLQITFQGINLNDEAFYKFQKDEKYNAQYEEYGPTYKLGIVYSNF